MGGTWFYGGAYYGYNIQTDSPFRYAMVLEGRMKFEHEDIKLHTFITEACDRMVEEEYEHMVCLLFGFSVNSRSAEQFMELKQTLDTYMKDADFKGKELFEEPSFVACVENYEYEDYQSDANTLDNPDDMKEYNEYLSERKRIRIERCIANIDKAIAEYQKKKEEDESCTAKADNMIRTLQKQKDRMLASPSEDEDE